MSRGVRKPGFALGVRCRVCATDEWYRNGRGKRICLACSRRRARAYGLASRQQDPALAMWRSARKRARAEHTAFLLTVEDIRAVWPPDGRCPVLGVPFRPPGNGQGGNVATLDRLNNAWGYEQGNVAVISMAANRAKGSLRASELERVAAWMRRHGLD